MLLWSLIRLQTVYLSDGGNRRVGDDASFYPQNPTGLPYSSSQHHPRRIVPTGMRLAHLITELLLCDSLLDLHYKASSEYSN